MVSTISPGATGANALGVDHRFARSNGPAPQTQSQSARSGDRVELGDAASLRAARDSVRGGLDQVHQVLAIGAEAQAMLVQVLQIAREGGSQDQLDAVLSAYSKRIDDAVGNGAKLASGATLSVQAEPGADPVEVAGADLRLKQDPSASQIIQIPSASDVGNADLAKLAQSSLDALQKAMETLLDAARSLEAHQGFLGAAESVSASNADLDADGARLLALQVRQGLEALGSKGIANSDPQAVLSLFRA